MPQEGGQVCEWALPTANFQDEHASFSRGKPMEVANREERLSRFSTVGNGGLN